MNLYDEHFSMQIIINIKDGIDWDLIIDGKEKVNTYAFSISLKEGGGFVTYNLEEYATPEASVRKALGLEPTIQVQSHQGRLIKKMPIIIPASEQKE